MSAKPRLGLFSYSRARHKSRCRSCSLKGRMQNIIVVKPPNPMFRQAVFFLRDDYFLSSDISRAELLAQAQDAATGFVNEQVPPVKKHTGIIIVITALIVFAAGFAIFLYLT